MFNSRNENFFFIYAYLRVREILTNLIKY